MMNGYSRISEESRSMEMEDVPETPKAKAKDEGGNGKGERFGVILGRSASVSCSSASGGFQFTMKRAFSMRRSSSVSERYCRIHDQYTAITSPEPEIGSKKKQKQRGSNILKACKRLLRL